MFSERQRISNRPVECNPVREEIFPLFLLQIEKLESQLQEKERQLEQKKQKLEEFKNFSVLLLTNRLLPAG
ncbi:hypothetical protein Sta7437_4562 (plasmid) [Stanieria cyanosphaera PCC 7437]|uniref:Uncharacterized protein n=1 Tax=Stanieria cyanosphaera (strain ATCC 29371 / PCC 7437) TaxID=111780 RepID=K9Y0V5_STAC7|nr:hypothetical protein [Stanieria cyanosphaera]AFZ38021.1 hypothetical protein Sta7437_4562 [Stanieria cyanosphaera PCC 7437]